MRPLPPRCEVILARQDHAQWLEEHAGLIGEELNIKSVDLTADADKYVSFEVKANFKALGPRFGVLRLAGPTRGTTRMVELFSDGSGVPAVKPKQPPVVERATNDLCMLALHVSQYVQCVPGKLDGYNSIGYLVAVTASASIFSSTGRRP